MWEYSSHGWRKKSCVYCCLAVCWAYLIQDRAIQLVVQHDGGNFFASNVLIQVAIIIHLVE